MMEYYERCRECGGNGSVRVKASIDERWHWTGKMHDIICPSCAGNGATYYQQTWYKTLGIGGGKEAFLESQAGTVWKKHGWHDDQPKTWTTYGAYEDKI
jgi:hypothetical protein